MTFPKTNRFALTERERVEALFSFPKTDSERVEWLFSMLDCAHVASLGLSARARNSADRRIVREAVAAVLASGWQSSPPETGRAAIEASASARLRREAVEANTNEPKPFDP